MISKTLKYLFIHVDLTFSIISMTHPGENCHRGAALGALLGAAAANNKQGAVPAKLKDGLHTLKSDIQKAVTEMNGGF